MTTSQELHAVHSLVRNPLWFYTKMHASSGWLMPAYFSLIFEPLEYEATVVLLKYMHNVNVSW